MNDAFTYLANFGSNLDTVVLITLPLAVLFLIALIFVFIAILRRKKERTELKQFIESNYEEKPILQYSSEPSPLQSIISPQKAVVSKEDWKDKLARGLDKTRTTLQGGLRSLFQGKPLITAELLERLHEELFKADFGVTTVEKFVDFVSYSSSSNSEMDWPTLCDRLKTKAEELIEPSERTLSLPQEKPWIILVVGVNGVGKTTTIGKLTLYFQKQGKTVLLGAADTFRAAAIDQLQIWGDRLGVQVIKNQPGSDPAAVAFDSVRAAKSRNTDVLIIDTAGRLHSKNDLMAELAKIKKVIGKETTNAPHEIWLVLDATTGQNAVLQVKAFLEAVKITGLIVTKLDGTAKGGVLIGIIDQFGIPVRFIGIGEGAEDLRPFSGKEFIDSIFSQK